ncbi:Ubiquitin carboxyl-terminal hydrolase 6 [Erysiphe neolycopersici]|uniref:Ubiquitin carboxyl-terminal hydrolase n=1 Tax=Erysiphe neolycopersici TaxID=212602 RepID=A0A420HV66_9PEZI|nr:Ubiquitin carboxyl-terminal hydrolase 6 [Erysiphe neolycopersici]
MTIIPVFVKHKGKKYEVDLDPGTLGEVFKFQVFSLTGVQPERQKILVKGGQLKDDTDLSKIGAKPGQVFMMMGTPAEGGADLQRPKETIKFIEDMTEAEAAQQVGATPAGLQNLGNTCYLNSTIQMLRAIPELQHNLAKYIISSESNDTSNILRDLSMVGFGNLIGPSDIVLSLKELFQKMSETQEGFQPYSFLNTLRKKFPQFAEKSKSNNGYAQQDAEEAWSQIVHQIREKLKIKVDDSNEISFVDKYMAGSFYSSTLCDEQVALDAGEEVTKCDEPFLKLDCHINANINHLRDGILAGLEQKLEKHSSILSRDTTYTKKSQISRLPKYLTVHFVRFFWKRESQKKVKIMRKVTFPEELDVVEFCTDELKKTLIPIRDKVREIRKDEEDMERARKRQKRIDEKKIADEKSGIIYTTPNAAMDPNKDLRTKKSDNINNFIEDVVCKSDAELEAERVAAIISAKREVHSMVKSQNLSDDGANKSGLYELRGIVTHQGASADGGHYTSFIKKQGPLDPKTGQRGAEDGKWWWFNDDKVSEVESEKIKTLSGGGESHSALILLYRAVPLPEVAPSLAEE